MQEALRYLNPQLKHSTIKREMSKVMNENLYFWS